MMDSSTLAYKKWVVVALLWGIQYAALTGRVILSKSRRRNQESDDSPKSEEE